MFDTQYYVYRSGFKAVDRDWEGKATSISYNHRYWRPLLLKFLAKSHSHFSSPLYEPSSLLAYAAAATIIIGFMSLSIS